MDATRKKRTCNIAPAIEVKRRTAFIEKQTTLISAMEAATGLDIKDAWMDDAAFAEAVAFVHRSGVTKSYGGVESLVSQARAFADRVEDVIRNSVSKPAALHFADQRKTASQAGSEVEHG